MAILIQARGLGHSVGQRTLFDNIDLTIAQGDRIGLVGHNGCGKSTLLGLLGGDQEPEVGEVIHRRGLRLGRVEQFLPTRVARLSAAQAVATAADSSVDTGTDSGSGLGTEAWRIEALLSALGFSQAEMGYRAGDLSGGQQNRVMFARALIADPELVLLDEPTNHLDLATIRVFEDYLLGLRISYLVVSHDRAFLDAVAEHTVFLRDQRLYRFDLPYSAAREALREADAAARRSRHSEERRIEGLRVSAKRLAVWGKVYDNEKLSRRARNIERRAARLEADRTFVSRGSGLDLDLEFGAMRAKEVLRVEPMDVKAAGSMLFRLDQLLIRPGERVALLGANGSGKSTFIRALVNHFRGKTAHDSIRFSPQAVLGYYDQELDEAAAEMSLIEFVSRRANSDEGLAKNRLIGAGFPYSEHGKNVLAMSGGERARALFVVLSLSRPNFLILDEPTNHLDIDGKEQLEVQLLESGAALLVTAHDRRFLDTIAERFLRIDKGVVLEVPDPNEFYLTPEIRHAKPAREAPLLEKSLEKSFEQNSDDVLARIVELEEKLGRDRARKRKFQKPALQIGWQAQLEQLYRRLEDD